jgi:hypothetical protein
MQTIGTIAAFMYVVLGVIMLSPLFLMKAIYESYEKFDFWGFMHDLPNWVSYILIALLSTLFWFCAIKLIL